MVTDIFFTVVDCGSPPGLINANITVDGTTFGHTTKYTCDRGYWFNRGQYQIMTKCEDNGNWTHLEETCIGM